MKFAYSNGQMRRADAHTVAEGTPESVLMERAGEALADTVQRVLNERGIQEALFVCGNGNNGGDGYVAARILLKRGYDVAVLSTSGKRAHAYEGEIYERMPRRYYPVVVDCILGTGLRRAPEGDAEALINFVNSSGAYVISCDLPSGLAENGIALWPCVKADETVSMGLLKSALLMADGADLSGQVTVADIGIQSAEEGVQVWEDSDIKTLFPRRKSHTHKGNFGTAAVIGGAGSVGACFLAADACLKSGAGYTKLFLPAEVYPHAIGKLNACILREFYYANEEILSADAVAVGMGFGNGKELYEYLEMLLKKYEGVLVLDADALTSLGKNGADILKHKKCRVILTPHPKEFARLTGKSVAEVLKNAVELAESYGKEYGVTVILKNNRTVITDGERTAVNPTGSPSLAKGGSGDVLTGLIVGTAARGVAPFEAAVAGSYLLGRAGELAAEEMGEYSPAATDIIGYLPQAIKSL